MSTFNKEIFSKNLNEQLKKSGKSQTDLVEDLGFSKSAISEWMNGKKYPRIDAIQKLSDYFGIVKSDLIEQKHLRNDMQNRKGIPVLGTVPCGEPIEAIEDIIGYVDSFMLEDSSNVFALIAKGDSMSPTINDGDIIIVKQQPAIDSGKIGIVKVNGDEATCKKVILSDNGLLLNPINENHTPMFFSKQQILNEPVVIVGQVLEVRKKL